MCTPTHLKRKDTLTYAIQTYTQTHMHAGQTQDLAKHVLLVNNNKQTTWHETSPTHQETACGLATSAQCPEKNVTSTHTHTYTHARIRTSQRRTPSIRRLSSSSRAARHGKLFPSAESIFPFPSKQQTRVATQLFEASVHVAQLPQAFEWRAKKGIRHPYWHRWLGSSRWSDSSRCSRS